LHWSEPEPHEWAQVFSPGYERVVLIVVGMVDVTVSISSPARVVPHVLFDGMLLVSPEYDACQ